MEGFVQNMEKLTIFVICARALVYFRPKDSYEKYLRHLMNMLIVVQVMCLFLGFLGSETIFESTVTENGKQFFDFLSKDNEYEILGRIAFDVQKQESSTEDDGVFWQRIKIDEIGLNVETVEPCVIIIGGQYEE